MLYFRIWQYAQMMDRNQKKSGLLAPFSQGPALRPRFSAISCPGSEILPPTSRQAATPPPRAAAGSAGRETLGQVTSLFVRKVLAEVDGPVDRAALLRPLGMDPDRAEDPALMVPAADYYTFLEKLTAIDTAPASLPLRVGAAMRCDDYGAFGLAWKSAPDLRGSYARAERYARVLTSVSTYELEWVAEGAFMHLHRAGPRRRGLRLSNEATIASLVAISRQVASREFRPLAVHFRHPAPGPLRAHEIYFGCPVLFGSDRDGLLVSKQTLQTPNKLGDAAISSFFSSHLEAEVARFPHGLPLERQVLDRISRSLSEGVPRVADVAADLCLSARTLQRHLSKEGHSFVSLVDEARRQLAVRLVTETDYALGDIAFMAGFSDQSALNRAFRRWEGQTPRSFRIEARHPSGPGTAPGPRGRPPR